MRVTRLTLLSSWSAACSAGPSAQLSALAILAIRLEGTVRRLSTQLILWIGRCSIQWYIIGYSLVYGEGTPVVGGIHNAFRRRVLAEPVGTIPAIFVQ